MLLNVAFPVTSGIPDSVVLKITAEKRRCAKQMHTPAVFLHVLAKRYGAGRLADARTHYAAAESE